MTPPRLVSVVVPTHNRPDLLRQALVSICALEGPDLRFEILIGDNGCDPQSAAVAADFGAHYLRVWQKGASAARNAGLFAASGEFIAFLDDDDLWTRDHIRAHIAQLDRDPELIAVFGQTILTDIARRPISEAWPASLAAPDALRHQMLGGFFPQIGSTLIRASDRDRIGGFDPVLTADQDWDWHLRLAGLGPIGFVPTICTLFRQRPPGSYDALQRMRVGFTRRVFFRHLFRSARSGEVKLSALQAAKLYASAMSGYFDYFWDAFRHPAPDRSLLGRWRALMSAFCLLPTRFVRRLWSERIKPRAIERRQAATLHLDFPRKSDQTR